jgi:hypothetical protein
MHAIPSGTAPHGSRPTSAVAAGVAAISDDAGLGSGGAALGGSVAWSAHVLGLSGSVGAHETNTLMDEMIATANGPRTTEA